MTDNYKEILEEVSQKLKSLPAINSVDISNIKNSVESIENLVTDTQAKLNFQEIKEKLETIKNNIDSCNEAFIKNLYNDINELKIAFNSMGENLESIKNTQNTTVTKSEFEEYQKKQIDLSLKNNENIIKELANSKIHTNSTDGVSSEGLEKIELGLENLHKNLTEYLKQFTSALQNVPNVEEMSSILNSINVVQSKNIAQTNELLKDLQTGVSNFREDIRNSDFANQISKISAIYDSMNIIQAWIEKAGVINKSVESLYSKLGQDFNFDDISKKVSAIYENITDLSNLTMRIDKVSESLDEIENKITESKGAVPDALQNVDIESVIDKIDIVYENVSALNSWARKIDVIDKKLTENPELDFKIKDLSSKIDEVKQIISLVQFIKSKVDNTLSEEVDFVDISNKVDIVYENMSSLNEWAGKIDNISQKLGDSNSEDDENLISKIDLIVDNIMLLNDWAKKIDIISKKNEIIDLKLDDLGRNSENIHTKLDGVIEKSESLVQSNDNLISKIEEINTTLDKTTDAIDNVPNLADKISELSDNMHSSLLDIESDFLKLHKFLDDNSQLNSNDILALKEHFSQLNDDISSISVRTNKLILTADDANKEFKSQLEIFKNTISEFNLKQQEQNSDVKLVMLGEKINKLNSLMQNSIAANKNLNSAFIYLAEWIDASGNVLNTIQKDITSLKTDDSNKTVNADEDLKSLKDLKTEIQQTVVKLDEMDNVLSGVKSDDVPELKSMMSGIIVQLETSLTPSINLINEKIDKLSDDNDVKLKQFESDIIAKIDAHSKQIDILNNNIQKLNKKFDTLIEIFSEDNKDYEMKDMLNYIVSEINSIREVNKANQSNEELLKKLESKVSDFDSSINKIVSYIEED